MNIVQLHAIPLDEQMWEPQYEALDDFDVFAPNLYALRGTMEQRAEGVLDQVEGDLVAVGASMGGYCALALAALAPERVRALALVGSRADADSDERRRARADTIAVISSEGAEGLWRAMRPRLFPPEAPVEAVERARAIALQQEPESLVAAVEAIRDRADRTDVARSLGGALLVVAGSRDPFISPAEARALGNGAVVVLDGAGHLQSLERPEEFNAVLLEFLARWR